MGQAKVTDTPDCGGGLCSKSVREYVQEAKLWYPSAGTAKEAAAQMEAHGAAHGWHRQSGLPDDGKSEAVVFLNTDNPAKHVAVYSAKDGLYHSDGKRERYSASRIRSIWVPNGEQSSINVATPRKHRQAPHNPKITIVPHSTIQELQP